MQFRAKLIAIVLTQVLATLLVFATMASTQGGGGQPSLGLWTVADDGVKTVVANSGAERTYRVTHVSGDSTLKVKVYPGPSGEPDVTVELTSGNSVDVTVPEGGYLKIEDVDDADAIGASGTYQVVP